MYYNDEKKQRYLSLGDSVRNQTVRLLFRWFAKSEGRLNKDLCAFSNQEIQETLQSDVCINKKPVFSVFEQVIVHLKQYITWCAANGDQTVCNIQAIHLEPEAIIRKYMFSSPKHLQSYLNQVFEPEDEDTVDVLYRTVVWLIYAGIYMNGICLLPRQAVNLDDFYVEYNGRQYPIYLEGIKAIRKTATLDEFVYHHPSYTITRKRLESDLLLRGVRSTNTDAKAISAAIRNKAVKAGVDYYLNMISISQYFFREFEKESMGFEPDFAAVVAEEIESENFSMSTAAVKQRIRNSSKLYANWYQYWKQTFYGHNSK